MKIPKSPIFSRLRSAKKASSSIPETASVAPETGKRALLLGHSNVFALRLAGHKEPSINHWLDICALHGESLKPEVSEVDGKDALHSGILARIDEHDYSAIFLTIGGGPHIQLGIVPQDQPFDFVSPEDDAAALIPGARLLPYGSVLDVLRHRNDLNFRVLRAIREHYDGPLYFIDYPPALRDEDVRANPKPFDAKIASVGINPFAFRRKLRAANLAVMHEVCEKLDCAIIPAPTSMLNNDGSLAKDGLFQDPIHGGVQYGLCVANQIKHVIGGN